jgi:hypothetical protein
MLPQPEYIDHLAQLIALNSIAWGRSDIQGAIYVCQVTTSFDSAHSANMRGAWVVTVLILAAVGDICASRVPEEQLLLREETTARTSAAAGTVSPDQWLDNASAFICS